MTTQQLEPTRETNARDARSAKVTNRHSEPMHLTPMAPHVRQHSFIGGIMETSLLKGYRGMHLDKYDSTIDLGEYLANCITQLLANSIDSFKTLKKRFNTQYSTRQPHHHFYGAGQLVFFDILCKLPPKDMDDQRIRASNYIQMEEMAEFCDSVHIGQFAPYNHKDHVHLGQMNGKKGKSERLTQVPKYQVFTPQHKPSTLFEEACSVDLITLPLQHWLAHGANKTNYYRYHKNYDHTTEG
ncbi:hypothetical protein CR513_04356, partial [Mucuna pruriens]